MSSFNRRPKFRHRLQCDELLGREGEGTAECITVDRARVSQVLKVFVGEHEGNGIRLGDISGVMRAMHEPLPIDAKYDGTFDGPGVADQISVRSDHQFDSLRQGPPLLTGICYGDLEADAPELREQHERFSCGVHDGVIVSFVAIG